jgi:glycosyltransferase involved in cell wall biosynthesis
MGVGVPVLAKRIPGLTEVGADGPLWVESTATREQIARALTALLRDPDLRRRHIDAGRARAAAFTWSRAAELTARTIRRAAEDGRGSAARLRRIGRPSA